MKRYASGLMIIVIVSIGVMSMLRFNVFQPSIHNYPSSSQFDDGRFHNPRPAQPGEMPTSTIRTFWDVFFNKPEDTVPSSPIPIHQLTQAKLEAAPNRSLYRLGHSTILMKLQDEWFLIDPVFSERASPVKFAGPKRFHPVPIVIDDLPPIRAVIISHDHYDHLDRATLRRLDSRVSEFITPLGVGDRLVHWGIEANKVNQFDWWGSMSINDIAITATPAQHFSGRGLRDGNATLWASWVIEDKSENDTLKVFFSGDTGYFDGFTEIGERFGPFDITLMETGAYNERWSYAHLHPEESVQAHLDLDGQWLLPIHNGTFDLAFHAWDDPFEQVLHFAEKHGVKITTPMIGERIDMTAPHQGDAWWRTLDQ
ncbi:MBL fold metallo-hydrolase [Aliidiomarina indica]|uniref:MBL fold metallo-hydrolase n=1 Tax=Aliidiomarina indica TaxID=2749147 RepID=UPI001E439C3A|nr:MBL fold metallo-hydrolase [Aliidiomarina indica]